MAAKSPLNVILGAGNIGNSAIDQTARFDTPDQVNGFINAFYNRGYHQIDTASAYSPHAPGSSEPRLGAVDAGKRFLIDTKVRSRPGDHKKEEIQKNVDEQLEALKIEQINIEYLHQPDRSVPFEETLESLDQAYRQGKFKKLGLSNYSAADVEQINEICERRGFVKPSVYQGQYNAIVRGGETELFPVLRKYNIAFYAWSPAAGGFFANNYKKAEPGGRFDPNLPLGKLYSSYYLKPSIEKAKDSVGELAAKHGINTHAAALRWTVYHSILSNKYDDAVVIGASSSEQLVQSLDMIEAGPLSEDLVRALDSLYEQVAGDEILYHR
ncbi:Aldo-keto reductase [Cladobotryum mycophilum]|uniref:Aldo-keto reductase n=1 Tax=Cladobotryum mycophilum TaxID=491253 RepID=A0ABR0SBV1_9HYPO